MVSLAGNGMKVAEAEFAFRMAQDLPPRPGDYTVSEVMAAVAALHPAIEIPDSRYEDFVTAGEAQLLADDACAHLFVLGQATTADWQALDLVAFAPRGLVRRNEQAMIERTGCGANVLGDPRLALTWLVNELSRQCVVLKAGQVVTTGTCMAPLAVDAGDRVDVDFGVLGKVEIGFAA
jgi:2-keto-4-pentenoate hydratase